MEQQSTTSLRTTLQLSIYKVIDPFVKVLIKLGLTPNAVTSIGFVLNIGVAVIFVLGAEEGNRGDLTYVGWAGGLILFAGLFDMLDGQVARLGNMKSVFGALYDSVLDRYSELIMFLGICWYLVAHHYFLSSLFAFIALIGSMMVSYVRARAEGLGIECKGGLMQRPERVITIGLCAILCGLSSLYIGGDYKLYIPGIKYHVFETMSIFTIPIAALAVLTNITAFNRLMDAKKACWSRKNQKNNSLIELKRSILTLLLCSCLIVLVKPAASALTLNKYLLTDTLKKRIKHTVSYPALPNTVNRLFYIQRDPNTNTIVYEVNTSADGQPDADEPVHPYWIKYNERGQREELNYIQRKFAYGLIQKPLGNGKFDIRLVSYKKFALILMKAADGKYHIYATIAQKQVILNRIFVKIEGGSFWLPNVVYVEVKGSDPLTGQEIVDRFKP